ncbi:transposase [Bdellovibrio reynosensis]|uniref:Transposase n=1 Tax=Bdellovibrio reynosensis TaxID=2835041 RepID=A0ABY4C4H8_9BACT|nr:transposase [Bdellovibrio reynosensis]UOE99869.1 transposase [Bdellovibrio reynosensis]
MGRQVFENHTELPYHITARCINKDWFSTDLHVIWDVMSRQLYFLHFAFNVKIHAFVLMSNHFHLIVRTPDANLSEAMRYFMRETSREITFLSGRLNQTYGSRFHRSLIGSPLYYLHAYKYLYRNPVTAGLCEKVEDYPFSSIQGLIGESWLDIPISEDENWGSLRTREENLKWLNTAPSIEQWDEVRKGLKKSTFQLSPVNKQPSSLEDFPL